jgi:Uma2 family endonuclease
MIMVTHRIYTMEEYVEFAERMNDFGNFEWVNGEIVSVHGNNPIEESLIDYVLSSDFDEKQITTHFDMPTLEHDDIIANLIRLLIVEKHLRVYGQKTSVFIPSTGNAREPDVLIVDRKSQQRNASHQVLNPLVLVEVLSKSTAAKDKSDKLEEYQTIESLQEYVIVWQNTPKVVIYRKKAPNKWEQEILTGLEAAVGIVSLNVSIALKDIYENIDFAEATT